MMGPLTDLLHSAPELENAIARTVRGGTPMENLVVIEFAAEPVQPGVYRLLGAFRIGDAIVSANSGHDTAWLIKHGQLSVAGEDHYREELKLLQTNPFAEHLKKAVQIAGSDMAGLISPFAGGRVQIYEISANSLVGGPTPHPFAIREESMRLCWNRYLEALRALDSRGGWPVRLPNGILQRRRVRTNLFVRTRKTRETT